MHDHNNNVITIHSVGCVALVHFQYYPLPAKINCYNYIILCADLSTSSDNIQTSTVLTTSSGSHSTAEIEEPPSKRRREAAGSNPMPPPSD